MVCLLASIGKLPIEKALDLTLYLKHETEIMPVFQGLNELIPMYKLMEKRDMNEVETQFKVKTWNKLGSCISALLLCGCGRILTVVGMSWYILKKSKSKLTQYLDWLANIIVLF